MYVEGTRDKSTIATWPFVVPVVPKRSDSQFSKVGGFTGAITEDNRGLDSIDRMRSVSIAMKFARFGFDDASAERAST